jgi:hypothetical protein
MNSNVSKHLNFCQFMTIDTNKNNAYRGKEQAALLHEGSFNAELLGFYQDGEMKKVLLAKHFGFILGKTN